MDINQKIELIKWTLGSFVLVIITTIISYHFQDREQSLTEVTFYDKYATDLIVLNPEINKRRLLSQYFAHVTPNPKVRERWVEYYKEVNKEWLSQKNDTTNFFQSEIENKPMILPNNSQVLSNSKSKYERAIELERLGWESLLNNDIHMSISYFKKCEEIYPEFHSIYEVLNYLKNNQNLSVNEMKNELKKWTWKLPEDLIVKINNL